MFTAIFTKGGNFCEFLLSSLGNTAFPKWGLLLKKRICSMGADSFLKELTPNSKESKKENNSYFP